ncbi:5491_t:CDS:2, partial [Entrophospora sp. SA101]
VELNGSIEIRKNLWSQKAVKLCENPKWLDIHPIPNDLNLEDNTNYILYNLSETHYSNNKRETLIRVFDVLESDLKILNQTEFSVHKYYMDLK